MIVPGGQAMPPDSIGATGASLSVGPIGHDRHFMHERGWRCTIAPNLNLIPLRLFFTLTGGFTLTEGSWSRTHVELARNLQSAHFESWHRLAPQHPSLCRFAFEDCPSKHNDVILVQWYHR
jgi:hypothetical protein